MNFRIPKIQVRHNCLIAYSIPAVRPPSGHHPPTKKPYSGEMCPGSMSRIKKAIDIFVQQTNERWIYNPVTGKSQPFTLNFVTLTVSSHTNISIQEGYIKLMKPFLRKLRSTGKVSYIWKAEFQQRGQLHYHLTTDVFTPWQWIRSTWNKLQRKNRYLDDYARKTGHFDANSTDVHSVLNIQNLPAYLSKYMAKPVYLPKKPGTHKKPQYATGKVWDCSTDLKKPRFSFIPGVEFDKKLSSKISAGLCEIIKMDHCTIYKFDDPISTLSASDFSAYNTWKS